ncbi:hypothetical protein [Pseudomonas sp. UMAB-40]|uniref:hypothetical protein n=1 Tax=Pseudomonas sp. UMAB-40 TaxID=1365407 RepID=UPI001C59B908|nr:hypothetical protein [Pseudomonas sp. UMAB-40]
MKFKLNNLLLAVLLPMMAGSAFAGAPYNVFLSGQVMKGDTAINSFAAPIRIGGTFPVKAEVGNGAGKLLSEVNVTITPKGVVGNNVLVVVTGYLIQYPGTGKHTGDVVPGPISDTNYFSQTVEIPQGQPTVFPFGDCKTPTTCSHSIVLSASAQ